MKNQTTLVLAVSLALLSIWLGGCSTTPGFHSMSTGAGPVECKGPFKNTDPSCNPALSAAGGGGSE